MGVVALPLQPPMPFACSFMRSSPTLEFFCVRLPTAEPIKDWLLTMLKEKLVKIGATSAGAPSCVPDGRTRDFEELFADIL